MENNRKRELNEMISRAQSGLDTYMPYFQEYYKSYKAMLSEEARKYFKESGKSSLPFYYILVKLQRIQADFVEAYFTNKQFAKINEKPTIKGTYYDVRTNQFVQFGINRHIHHASVKALQNAVDYYTVDDENCKLYEELSKASEDLLMYGTVAVKCSWENGIKIETKDIKDIAYDPNSRNYYDSRYVTEKIYLTVDEIVELRNSGAFDSEIDIEKIAPDHKNNKYKRICITEVYEKIGGKWYVSSVFNTDTVLRDKVNLPYGNPIFVGTIRNQKIDPIGDDTAVRVYGDSIIAPLIPLQREMTILRNQQLDIVDRQLNPRFITNDPLVNPFDFVNQKKRLIQGNKDKIHQIDTPNIKDSIFNLDRLSVEGQEAIGVTDYNSGNASNKQLNDTATGISILTSESNKILAHYIRGYNETLIKQLFTKITDLVWAYGDARFFYGIDRTLKLEYQVGVDVGLGATNKEMQLQSRMVAYKGIMELATLTQDPIKLERAEKFFYKEILSLLGIENYEEYYSDETGTDQQIGNVGQDPNMGVPSELLGRAEKGLNATGRPSEYGNEPFYNGAIENN